MSDPFLDCDKNLEYWRECYVIANQERRIALDRITNLKKWIDQSKHHTNATNLANEELRKDSVSLRADLQQALARNTDLAAEVERLKGACKDWQETNDTTGKELARLRRWIGCTCGQGSDPDCPWIGHHEHPDVKAIRLERNAINGMLLKCERERDTALDEVERLKGERDAWRKNAELNQEDASVLRKEVDRLLLQPPLNCCDVCGMPAIHDWDSSGHFITCMNGDGTESYPTVDVAIIEWQNRTRKSLTAKLIAERNAALAVIEGAREEIDETINGDYSEYGLAKKIRAILDGEGKG